MKKQYHSSTIQKALDILLLFSEKDTYSFSELQKRLELNKSTLFRVLANLIDNRFLRKTDQGEYELGMAMFTLGNRMHLEHQLQTVARPLMERLSEKLDLTVHLGILDGLDVVIIAKINPQRWMRMVSRIGSAVPAHCTGQGKTLLAFSPVELVHKIVNAKGMQRFTPSTITTVNDLEMDLAAIRRRGYTIDHSEHEKDIRCVGVPIFGEKGQMVAALSVTGLPTDFPDDASFEKTAHALFEAREQISQAMGYTPTPSE